LAVGRQEPQKGFDVLFNALPAVRSRLPELRVLVAGREGRSTRALAEQVRGAGLGETVTFLGMRDDVPDLMCAANVLAFPSRWEGAAGTLIEAMALECPIVTSRLPTLLETVDESTAELVSPGDPDDLARGLLDVLADGPGMADQVSHARQRFESGYSVEVSARRMSHLYSRVAPLA
jgi:glycosyltransferase involved in cell wall biosynthesis